MIDKPLLTAVMILLTISLLMSYSLSTYVVLYHNKSTDLYFFARQGAAVFAGFFSMIVLSKIDPDRWFLLLGSLLFIFFFSLMIAMQFLPVSFVKDVGGAKRWIDLGAVSIAPVEFFKVGFVFFLAWSLSRKFISKAQMRYSEEIRAFFPYISVFLLAVVIIAVFQKDLGQVMVLGGTLLILFLFAGSSFKLFFTLLLAAFSGVIGLIFLAPHRMIRIIDWWGTVQDDILALFPFESIQSLRVETGGEPYQLSHSLNAIYNGAWFGQGLGNGQFKLGYLADVHTDFVLAGISEELGFFTLVFVVSSMLFIIFRIFKIASKVRNPIYYLFSIGVGSLFALSFILNSYGISGIMPIKGIAVPFLSYGGSHILASCIAIGMVLMVSKKVPRDAQGEII